MKSFYFLGMLMSSLVVSAFGQAELKTIFGEYLLMAEDSHCIGDLKRIALDQAKITALAAAFGTTVAQGNDLLLTSISDSIQTKTSSRLSTISFSEVKGEWVKSLDEKLNWEIHIENGKERLYLRAKVKGKAKQVVESTTALELAVMSCLENEKCISPNFTSGDPFYLKVKSASDGFLAVFLKEGSEVYQLFPYPQIPLKNQGGIEIERNIDYILFSADHYAQFPGLLKSQVNELALETGVENRQFSELIVTFSTSSYPAVMGKELSKDDLKKVSFEHFGKWILKNEASDPAFQRELIYLTIEERK